MTAHLHQFAAVQNKRRSACRKVDKRWAMARWCGPEPGVLKPLVPAALSRYQWRLWLIENENLRIMQNYPGNGDSLLFSTGKVHISLPKTVS